MELFTTIAICFIAGIAAGLGTGFAGMSAAVAISPILITFVGMDAYEAIGIALASDVLASAVSAWTYYKNKNFDLRDGVALLISVLAFTAVGSYVATWFSASTMSNLSVFMSMFLGIKFLVRPVMSAREPSGGYDGKRKVVLAIICGVFIGFMCGFVGAGGGIMMLIALTSVLGSDLKTAVGTSVFVMTFTALTGAVSHFVIGGIPDLICLTVCVISTLIWARIAARIANRALPSTLNRIAGLNLVLIGIAVLAVGLI